MLQIKNTLGGGGGGTKLDNILSIKASENLKAGDPVEFKVELPDGITVTFSGFASVTIAGGAVNDAMTFTLSINLNSDLVIA